MYPARVEDVRLDDAVELRVLVAAGEEHPAVEEVRQPAAEDVEARVDVDRRLRAGLRIPDRRARVVVHRVGLGRVVADRVVRQHLAVRQQRDMHADDRPVDDGPPLAHVLRGRQRWLPLPRLQSNAVTARVCASSARSCAAVCVTASSEEWPGAVSTPWAPAPDAASAVRASDAASVTPSRDNERSSSSARPDPNLGALGGPFYWPNVGHFGTLGDERDKTARAALPCTALGAFASIRAWKRPRFGARRHAAQRLLPRRHARNYLKYRV